MRSDRWVLRILFLLAFAAGTIMAWNILPILFAESYSDNALRLTDPWLRAYLGPASLAFGIFYGMAANKEETFKFNLKVVRWTIRWKWLYLTTAMSFVAVSVTNVSQLYWPHIFCTFMVALSAYVMAWNYFTSWKRVLAIAWATFGTGYFAASFILKVDTTAKGEWWVSFAIISIAWVMINELIREK